MKRNIFKHPIVTARSKKIRKKSHNIWNCWKKNQLKCFRITLKGEHIPPIQHLKTQDSQKLEHAWILSLTEISVIVRNQLNIADSFRFITLRKTQDTSFKVTDISSELFIYIHINVLEPPKIRAEVPWIMCKKKTKNQHTYSN